MSGQAVQSSYYLLKLYNEDDAEIMVRNFSLDIDLSVSAKNRLLGARLVNLFQVAQMSQSELCSIQYMGKKHAQEIIDFCSHLKEESFVNELLSTYIHLEESHHASSLPMNIEEPDEGRRLVDELNDFLGKSEKNYQKTLSRIREEHPDARGESIVYLLYEDPDIHKKAKDAVLGWMGGQLERIRNYHDLYNLQLFRIAATERVPIIDVTSPFMLNMDYSQCLCEDGIHPTSLGHDIIATQILRNWKHLLSSF